MQTNLKITNTNYVNISNINIWHYLAFSKRNFFVLTEIFRPMLAELAASRLATMGSMTFFIFLGSFVCSSCFINVSLKCKSYECYLRKDLNPNMLLLVVTLCHRTITTEFIRHTCRLNLRMYFFP